MFSHCTNELVGSQQGCAGGSATPCASMGTGLHLQQDIACGRLFVWAHMGSIGILHLDQKRSPGLGHLLLTHPPSSSLTLSALPGERSP